MKNLIISALVMFCTVALAAEQSGITTTPINDTLYLMQGRGGNVLASVGADGVLLIDDDYGEYGQAYEAALRRLTDASTRFVINTHWHGDHTGSNEFWGKRGAVIVAQDNVRERLSTLQSNEFFGRQTPPSDPAAWPLVTFPESMALHLNGDTIELQYYPNGHTDGDAVVFFTNSNVVHMGDHFFKDRFPFVDISSGGHAGNYADNVAEVLQKVDAETVIVPGHGSLANKADLQRYHAMLVGTLAEVERMRADGMTLEQVQAEGLGEQWQSFSGGFINEETWIAFLYLSFDQA